MGKEVIEPIKQKVRLVSEEQIEAIKTTHPGLYASGKIKRVILPLDDEGNESLEVIVRVADRDTVTQFMRFNDSQPKKAQEIIINQCLLTSKDEVKADDHLFLTAVGAIAELFPIRQATIKNL
jgi:hypothetical protein